MIVALTLFKASAENARRRPMPFAWRKEEACANATAQRNILKGGQTQEITQLNFLLMAFGFLGGASLLL